MPECFHIIYGVAAFVKFCLIPFQITFRLHIIPKDYKNEPYTEL